MHYEYDTAAQIPTHIIYDTNRMIYDIIRMMHYAYTYHIISYHMHILNTPHISTHISV